MQRYYLLRRLDAGAGTLFDVRISFDGFCVSAMKYLEEKLREYKNTDIYPFHMPGHKRREFPFPNPYGIDITEIDGFDNLHHATDILKEAQERAAQLYGAGRSFYLVNGSTCGILAAVCAAAKKRSKVLVARNCHKAVYHALFLQELRAEYLYPDLTKNNIQGQITPVQVEEALKKQPDIAAVILTSPTYEGIVSDISEIAEIVHAYGIPLLIDEAHGAHFGFGAGFPENAVTCGADAVIMSLHKTLPSFTQTALLHLCSDRISEEKIKEYLGIFQTSSPSYLFMAGMDSCIRRIKEEGEELFFNYRKRLDDFYRDTADLQRIHVMNREELSKQEAFDWDDSKIVIFTAKTHLTGESLHRILLERYHLQVEMVSAHYVLAMTSIMDTQEGFERLNRALHEIDRYFQSAQMTTERNYDIINKIEFFRDPDMLSPRELYRKNPVILPFYEARELKQVEIPLDLAAGKISADMIYIYPPGIPMIVPGEMITEDFIKRIKVCLQKKLLVEGNADISHGRIKIVDT